MKEEDGMMRTIYQKVVQNIAAVISENGGKAYYTGRYVRDSILAEDTRENSQKSSRYIDLEIYGISPENLEKILGNLEQKIGFKKIGGSYWVKGCAYDTDVPHHPDIQEHEDGSFYFRAEAAGGIDEAARHRNFTCNAIMQDVLTGEMIDPFGGKQDIENRIVRHTDPEAFIREPLKVVVTARLAACLGFGIAEETLELCRNFSLSDLPREKVRSELEKVLLYSARPSIFFQSLRQMNQLDVWFPELKNTIGIPQDPKHHAEGDVWNHTMMVLDEAVPFAPKVQNSLGFMLSALMHDVGKAACTKMIGGTIHSYQHETAGIPLASAFMNRLGSPDSLIQYVVNMTAYHMKPYRLAKDHSSVKATNKMFSQVEEPQALLYLSQADGLGKIPRSRNQPQRQAFLAERLAVYQEMMSRPYVMERDLTEAGLRADKNFADYLSLAHKLGLAGISKEQALRQILAVAGKNISSHKNIC